MPDDKKALVGMKTGIFRRLFILVLNLSGKSQLILKTKHHSHDYQYIIFRLIHYVLKNLLLCSIITLVLLLYMM